MKDIAKEIEERIKLTEKDIVLDIGSNDATLLKAYKTEGINKIGIDPTGKQFEHFYTRDIKLISDFFNEDNFSTGISFFIFSKTSIFFCDRYFGESVI